MSDTKVLKQQESLSTALPIMSTIPDSLRPSSYLSHPPLPQLNPATTAPSSNQRLEAIGPTPLSPLQGFFPHTGSRLTVELANLGPIADYGLQRPRRDSSRAAIKALAVPRQLSPLDLSIPTPSAPAVGSSGSQRKVSHSLIERRRREKINDCLGSLKQIVPYCREEGERKEARARERGRKRGRKGDGEEDTSQRGGLHKLEILQGTILYIEELERRIIMLQSAVEPPISSPPALIRSESSASGSISPISTSHYDNPLPPMALSHPTLPFPTSNVHGSGFHSFGPTTASGLLPLIRSPSPNNVNVMPLDLATDNDAAVLLLRFSTSPEIRPVVFD